MLYSTIPISCTIDGVNLGPDIWCVCLKFITSIYLRKYIMHVDLLGNLGVMGLNYIYMRQLIFFLFLEFSQFYTKLGMYVDLLGNVGVIGLNYIYAAHF